MTQEQIKGVSKIISGFGPVITDVTGTIQRKPEDSIYDYIHDVSDETDVCKFSYQFFYKRDDKMYLSEFIPVKDIKLLLSGEIINIDPMDIKKGDIVIIIKEKTSLHNGNSEPKEIVTGYMFSEPLFIK